MSPRYNDSVHMTLLLFQDAGRNIMYWITFEHSSPQYLFQMTGNSIDVFNRYYTIGGLATVEGVCDITHTSTLDGANHLLRMEFSFSEYYADFFCMKAGDPVRLGYNPNYDYDTFRIDIDLNSLLIAVAVSVPCLFSHPRLTCLW